MKGLIKKATALFLAALMVVTIFQLNFVSFTAQAADFESSISTFPDSYKPYLRVLHEKYPKWEFKAVITGLDFNNAVKNEGLKDRSAVPKDSSDLVKSKESDYYNSSTGAYREVDAGWYGANALTVAYYMDPRNFLNETDIFQFELLSFSSVITTDTVEKILAGTFMANTKVQYYDTTGKLVKTSKTYADLIYAAGKKHNINPCFLASKIKNEVVIAGGKPSGSVSGTRSGYEGYYNFYNIGASAGADPIANGLKYAKTAGTYGRPWNTPEKSITGGAEFLASSYIAKGQDTGYLQKFNVSPNSSYSAYDHQYMQNISGADSQGYSTYQTYKNEGLLSLSRVFSIPVFSNMPGESSQTEGFILFDSYGQVGKVNTSVLNVRDSASVYGKAITTVSGGTQVKILSKTRTTSNYYSHHLYYPFWYEIEFTSGSKTYTGFVSADYVDISTKLNVNLNSTFELPIKSQGSEIPTFYTSDSKIVKINSNGTLTALKKGTAEITAVTSKNGYDKIIVNVGSYSNSDLAVKNFTVSASGSKATFSWTKNSKASGYEIAVFDGNNLVYSSTLSASATSCSVSGLEATKEYTAKIRAYTLTSSAKSDGDFSVVSKFQLSPAKVTGLTVSDVTTSSFKLSWSKAASADGYEVSAYNSETKKYEVYTTTTKLTVTVKNLEPGYSQKFKVRAYKSLNGQIGYGEYSSVVTGYTLKEEMPEIKESSVKNTSVTLSWGKVSSASEYEVYILDISAGTLKKLVTTKDTTYTASSLKANTEYQFTVSAVSSESEFPIASGNIKVHTVPNAPTSFEVSSGDSGKYTLKWDSVSGVEKYEVYKLNDSTNKYELYKTVTKNTLSVSSLKPLTSAKYKVRAAIYYNDKYYYSSYSSVLTASTGPDQVKSLKAGTLTTSSITLSWKKVTGATGYQIYKYDSSTKKYVKVKSTPDTTYKVSGLKAGTTYKFKVRAYMKISGTAFFGTYTSVLSASTKPATVTSLKAKTQAATSITLSWKKVTGATGYQIYKYDSSKKAYVKVKSTPNTSYKVSSLKAVTTYKFKVRAYKKLNGSVIYGAFSSVLSASTAPAAVKNLKATKSGSGIKLTWSKVTGATGYQIYKYNSTKKAYVKVKSTTANSYTVTGLTSGGTNLKVRAYKKVNGSTVYGAFTWAPSTPGSFKASSQTTSSITLTWNKSTDATGYIIYKYNSSKKAYVKVTSTTKNTYKVSNLKVGTTYKFKVRAYKKVGNVTLYSAYTSVLSATTKTATPTVTLTAGSKKATVSWKKISGASGYVVYMASSKSGTYKKIATVKSGSTVKYNKTGLTAGKTYYFKVRAYKTVSGTNIYSSYSAIKSVKVK